jgi:hypothetical protein
MVTPAARFAPVRKTLADLPRRIFLDSCAAQILGKYGGAIHEGEPIPEHDRIRRIPDGIANVEALASIFQVNERALFEWIVSDASLKEAFDKHDRLHMQWLFDIADHSAICLTSDGATAESEALAARLDGSQFGYLSVKDKILLRDAVILRCDAFLTVERKLPKNASHIECELGILVMTPVTHMDLLRPWAALWL